MQIKTNVFSINIYLKKLVQKLIIIINVKELRKIINTTILYICNNLISKKNRTLIKAKINAIATSKKINKNNARSCVNYATTIIYCNIINKVFNNNYCL